MSASIAALIAANLVPLAGVLFLGWEVAPLLLLYWSENLVVGGYNILKILFRPAEHPLVFGLRIFPAAFFCFHYGAFCGAHGFFLMGLTGSADQAGEILSEKSWPFLLIFMQMLVETIQAVWRTYSGMLFWPWVGLVISHGISFLQNFVRGEEYLLASTEKLMKQPYQRVVLLHVVIIAGGFTVMLLGSSLVMLCLLILGKMGLDITMHRREHRSQSEAGKT